MQASSAEKKNEGLPAGYIVITGLDGKEYLVPDWLASKVELDLLSSKYHENLQVSNQTHMPRHNLQLGGGKLGDLVTACVDPALSKAEWLALHANVKALQDQFGLSYKDATHRLYLAEVEKLKTIRMTKKAVNAIRQRIDTIIDHEIQLPLSWIDRGSSRD